VFRKEDTAFRDELNKQLKEMITKEDILKRAAVRVHRGRAHDERVGGQIVRRLIEAVSLNANEEPRPRTLGASQIGP
jgi:hypothetical protein